MISAAEFRKRGGVVYKTYTQVCEEREERREEAMQTIAHLFAKSPYTIDVFANTPWYRTVQFLLADEKGIPGTRIVHRTERKIVFGPTTLYPEDGPGDSTYISHIVWNWSHRVFTEQEGRFANTLMLNRLPAAMCVAHSEVHPNIPGRLRELGFAILPEGSGGDGAGWVEFSTIE